MLITSRTAALLAAASLVATACRAAAPPGDVTAAGVMEAPRSASTAVEADAPSAPETSPLPSPTPTTPARPATVGSIDDLDLRDFPWDVCGADVTEPDVIVTEDRSGGALVLLLGPVDGLPFAGVEVGNAVRGDATGDGVDDVVVPTYCVGANGTPLGIDVLSGSGGVVEQLQPVVQMVDSAYVVIEDIAVHDGAITVTTLREERDVCRACASPDTRVATRFVLVDDRWRAEHLSRSRAVAPRGTGDGTPGTG